MLFANGTDESRCTAFPTTLVGTPNGWFNKLPAMSVGSFKEFAVKFVDRFANSRCVPKSTSLLMTIKQGRDETLREYAQRFNDVSLTIPSLDDAVAKNAFMQGLVIDDVAALQAKKELGTLSEVLEIAQKYMVEEEMKLSRKGKSIGMDLGQIRVQESSVRRSSRSENPERMQGQYTLLNRLQAEILITIRGYKDLVWPPSMRRNPNKRDHGLATQHEGEPEQAGPN